MMNSDYNGEILMVSPQHKVEYKYQTCNFY